MKDDYKYIHSYLKNKDIYFKGFNLLFLSQVYVSEHFWGTLTFKGYSLINILKKCSLDNLAKFLHYKIIKQPFTSYHDLACKYLFVNEINNKAMIATLHQVYDTFDEKKDEVMELITDERLDEKKRNTVNIFHYVSFGILFKTLKDIFLIIPQLFKKRNEIITTSDKYNINVLLYVLHIFDSIFLVNTVEQFFKIFKASNIVLNTDVHKLSRLIVFEAKKRHIPTFVIQHGATNAENGYLPINADIMLAWGESSKKWFIDRMQDAQKIKIVGSPRMDAVTYQSCQQTYTKPPQDILIVMSEMKYEMEFLEIIRDAITSSSLVDIQVTVKMHPNPGGSTDYYSMIEKIFNNTPFPTKILKHYDIKQLITKADVVFVTTSTVGMETIIFNKPLVQIKLENLNMEMGYEKFDCSHIVRSREALAELFNNPGRLYEKTGNYKAFIYDYFYHLDGQAAMRAKNEIVKFSKQSLNTSKVLMITVLFPFAYFIKFLAI